MLLAADLKVNAVLTSLNLSRNSIGAEGGAALAEALKVNMHVASLNLLGNNIGKDAVAELVAVFQQHKTLKSLCGLKPDQTEADFSSKSLQPSDGMLLAADLKVNAVLASVNLLGNNIGMDAAAELAAVLQQHKTLKTLCGLKPEQTEADFSSKPLQPSDGMLLAADLKVNAVLTSLNLEYSSIGA